MGANLSGTYGDVLVHDTIDTVSFSPRKLPTTAKQILVLILIFFVCISLDVLTKARWTAGLSDLALLFGMFAAFALVVGLVHQACQPTLFLYLPDRKWIVQKVVPVQSFEHGNTYELMKIKMTRTDKGSDGAVDSYWSPILEWHWPPRTFALGRFGDEHEARAFAEELCSRLGIPVVDEPEPCKEIMENIATEVKKIKKITKAASSWVRLGARKG